MGEFIVFLYSFTLLVAEFAIWYSFIRLTKGQVDIDDIAGLFPIYSIAGIVVIPLAFVMGVESLVKVFNLG